MAIVAEDIKVILSGKDVENLVDVCEFARRFAVQDAAKELYGDEHITRVCVFLGNLLANCR